MRHIPKTYYFQNELTDDFSGITRSPKTIDKDYKFISNNLLWNLLAFIVYRILMTPIAYIYLKLRFHTKIIGKKKIRSIKTNGYFLYGNHTNVPLDGFLPAIISGKRKSYVVVHPDNVALKGTENYMKMIGAIPTPTTIDGMKPFLDTLEKRVNKNNCICIYPEAHIWPYYTKIRNFKSTSFKYPVKFDKPVFCFTTTYKKRRFHKRPKVVIYIDGPFYYNKELSQKESVEDLRNRVYDQMTKRSLNSDCEFIKYVRDEKRND